MSIEKKTSGRKMIFWGILALVTIGMVACAGTVTVKGGRAKGPGFDVGVDEATVTGSVATNKKLYVTFKKDGEPVGEGCIEGGEGTMPNPNGGDWDQMDYNTEKPAKVQEADPQPVGDRLNSAQIASLSGIDGLIAQPIPFNKEYTTGCLQGSYDTTGMNTNYTLTVSASSNDQAAARSAALGQNGVGAPVASHTHVDSYVRWTVIGSDVWIGSSKVGGDFVTYQLTVNGSVVADLGAGINVTPIDDGNGWKTLWSSVPVTDLNLGTNTIDIVQRAVGETQSYPITYEFGL